MSTVVQRTHLNTPEFSLNFNIKFFYSNVTGHAYIM